MKFYSLAICRLMEPLIGQSHIVYCYKTGFRW